MRVGLPAIVLLLFAAPFPRAAGNAAAPQPSTESQPREPADARAADRALLAQLAFEFDTWVEDADSAILCGDIRAAETAFEHARLTLRSDPAVLSPATLRRANARLTALRARIDACRGTGDEEKARVQNPPCRPGVGCGKTIDQLETQARILSDHRQYPEALRVVEQILVLDPRNKYALAAKKSLKEAAKATAGGL